LNPIICAQDASSMEGASAPSQLRQTIK